MGTSSRSDDRLPLGPETPPLALGAGSTHDLAADNQRPANVGLLASGASQGWDIQVDASLDEPEKCFVQIEGPSAYIYFELQSRSAIKDAVVLLDSPKAAMPVRIGSFLGASVSLVADQEYADRYFLTISQAANATVRFTFAGKSLTGFRTALQQVRDDLGDS